LTLTHGENSLFSVRRPAANLETRSVSNTSNKWNGVGGDAEVIAENLPDLLDLLLYLGPIPVRSRRLPNNASLFRQCAYRHPSQTWFSASEIHKTEFSVISGFEQLASANLNSFVAQE
jgi:hypothetical protein